LHFGHSSYGKKRGAFIPSRVFGEIHAEHPRSWKDRSAASLRYCHEMFGERFAPPKLLREIAAKGGQLV